MRLLLCCLLFIAAPALSEFKFEDHEALSHKNCKPFKAIHPDSPSIMYSQASGRLGNHLLLYAFMLQMHISLQLPAYVNDETIMHLNRYFTPESIKLKSLEATFCDHKNIKWDYYSQHIRPLLVDKSYRQGRHLYLFPQTSNEFDEYSSYRSESHVCPEHDKLNRRYHINMRHTLKFKPDIMERVTEIYDDVARDMGAKKRDLTFVAIHNRRTDHIKWTKKHHDRPPLEPEFFYDAMDEFREDFENCVFLFVSDDMAWARKNIKDKENDLFFVGMGDTDDVMSIGIDLAIMASANNTIITRGTYSMFASIFSGGEYYTEYGMIIPDHVMYPDDEHDELYL